RVVLEECDGLQAVLGLPDHFDLGPAGDEMRQGGPHEGVVIDEENADFRHEGKPNGGRWDDSSAGIDVRPAMSGYKSDAVSVRSREDQRVLRHMASFGGESDDFLGAARTRIRYLSLNLLAGWGILKPCPSVWQLGKSPPSVGYAVGRSWAPGSASPSLPPSSSLSASTSPVL